MSSEEFENCSKICRQYRMARLKSIDSTAVMFEKLLFCGLHMDILYSRVRVSLKTTTEHKCDKIYRQIFSRTFMFLGKSYEVVEDYLEYLKSKKSHIQPFLLLVFDDMTTVKHIFVFFDNMKYAFTKIVRATCSWYLF